MTDRIPDDTDLDGVRDVLEALNAEEVVDEAGEPPREVDSPASDADAPALPG